MHLYFDVVLRLFAHYHKFNLKPHKMESISAKRKIKSTRSKSFYHKYLQETLNLLCDKKGMFRMPTFSEARRGECKLHYSYKKALIDMGFVAKTWPRANFWLSKRWH